MSALKSKNKEMHILHTVMPIRYGLSLTEESFQDFFVLMVDGEQDCGSSDLEYLKDFCARIYGLDVPVEPIPVFTGFTSPST